MNKKAQVAFSPSDFSNSSPTEEPRNQNLFQKIGAGIAAVVFIILFTPVIVNIHTSMLSEVCVNPTTCLFFKFIVPSFIIGGIIAAVRYIWGKQ